MFADLIKQTRRSRGLGQADLARRAGTTQTYISRIERGDVSPSVSTVERLIHAMGSRLTVDLEPLSPGNAVTRDLQADFRNLTAEQRVEQAMELSTFLTGIADAARHDRSSDDRR